MDWPSLAKIIATARSGSAERAWLQFIAAGYDRAIDEPAALALKGRLLKDRARQAAGAERRRLFGEAAAAYAAAAAAEGATYPLINAASLYLLAGDPAEAARQAEAVLARVAARPDEPETPYWRAATGAEALLLLERDAEARAAFAEAIALAPQAWEDHASTLRQFALIHEAQGKDAAWLDAHRPPRSLHFGGHMAFDAGVSRRAHLDETVAALLEEERVGFGYGALAAGADIIVAEALVARGAELHALLPGGAQAFAAVSVDPFGKGWRKRFDALLGRAATVRGARPLGVPPDRTMVALGDELAMGAAAMNARRLESGALQLLVTDGGPAAAHARWGEAGWRQRIVAAPREAAAGAAAALASAPHRRLALLSAAAADPAQLGLIAAALDRGPAASLAPWFTGRDVVAGYDSPGDGARAALALAAAGAAVGGHYGLADPLDDPFGGGVRVGGEPAALAAAAAASAPAGSACVTEDFAAALAAAGGAGVQAELVGELDARDGAPPVDLYALKPRLD